MEKSIEFGTISVYISFGTTVGWVSTREIMRMFSVKKLYDAGVVSGDTDHNYRPSDNIKRSEVAKIICTLIRPEARDTTAF